MRIEIDRGRVQMGLRTLSLSIAAVVVLVPLLAHADTGSSIWTEYEVRLPEARKNPAATVASFKKSPADNKERTVLFMLVLTLGESQLISREEYQHVVDRGLVDVDEQIRRDAVHHIDHVYEGDNRRQLFHRCTLDKSLGVRYNAAEQLQDYPDEQSIAYLDGLLDDESIEVRDRAAGTLHAWHHRAQFPGVKEVFLQNLDSKDIRRAGVAARILATFFELPPRVDVLNAYLDAELDKTPPQFGQDNARAVIRLLGRISDPTSKPVLQKASQYPHRYVAADAREALLQMKDESK
jgi:HEAT repeat protein